MLIPGEPDEHEGIKAVQYIEKVLGHKDFTEGRARLEWILMSRDDRVNVIVAYRIMTRVADEPK